MNSNQTSKIATTLVASAVLAALSASVHAAENRAQRYTPGLGGSDMTTVLTPGWYGQLAAVHYHATKLKDSNGDKVSALSSGEVSAAQVAGAAGLVTSQTSAAALAGNVVTAVGGALGGTGIGYSTRVGSFRADAYVLQPRVTYLSSKQFLGAHVGFTAMVPLIERQTSLAGQTVFTDRSAQISSAVRAVATGASIPEPTRTALVDGITSNTIAGVQSSVNTAVASQLAGRSGSNTGIGDLEFGPVLNWEIGDHQVATLTPTLVVPTGEYNAKLAVNPGFGNFYTFRPSFQYGFIGDGWDVAARAVLSFNTRNKDTTYRSGTMLNVDFAAMKFVTEDLRLGVQGFVVQQLTNDSSDDAVVQATLDATNGGKMRAYALGPALGWIVNGGEMLVEGKILQEFGARNRAEGTTYMLMLSKPFGL